MAELYSMTKDLDPLGRPTGRIVFVPLTEEFRDFLRRDPCSCLEDNPQPDHYRYRGFENHMFVDHVNRFKLSRGHK